MDGIHDLGGMQGFGRIRTEGKRTPFHERWEMKVSALMASLAAGKPKQFEIDEYRHAIERLSPKVYVDAGYFERTYLGILTVCLEKGILTEAEFERVSSFARPPGVSLAAGDIGSNVLPDLEVGDLVKVRDENPSGHNRIPGYVRGKTGRVVAVTPAYHYPDAIAHGLHAKKQHTFDVAFRSRDLWGEDCDDALVMVGLFHGYLSKANA